MILIILLINLHVLEIKNKSLSVIGMIKKNCFNFNDPITFKCLYYEKEELQVIVTKLRNYKIRFFVLFQINTIFLDSQILVMNIFS